MVKELAQKEKREALESGKLCQRFKTKTCDNQVLPMTIAGALHWRSRTLSVEITNVSAGLLADLQTFVVHVHHKRCDASREHRKVFPLNWYLKVFPCWILAHLPQIFGTFWVILICFPNFSDMFSHVSDTPRCPLLGSALAKTTKTPASMLLEIQHLPPSSTQSLPSRTWGNPIRIQTDVRFSAACRNLPSEFHVAMFSHT